MNDTAAVPDWREYRLAQIKRRLNLVYAAVLMFFIIYSILDYLLFPARVAAVTVSLRLLVVTPCMLLVLWAHHRDWPYNRFLTVYAGSYLAAGLSVVAVITISHLNAVPVPYDGLFLALAFGYYLIALPVLLASLISFGYTLVYLALAWAYDFAHISWLLEAYFLLSANILGVIGAILLERSERQNFRQLCYIESARKRAVQDNRSKTRFLASASHDLRQPLGAIQLLLSGLGDQVRALPEARPVQQSSRAQGEPPSPNVEELLMIVQHLKLSSDLLQRQLRSFLDLSSLELGVISPALQRFGLNDVLRGLEAEFPTFLFSVEDGDVDRPDIVLASDRSLFERICSNLMDNAVKHARATRHELTVRLPKQAGDSLVLAICDNGTGLSKELIAHINDPPEDRSEFFANAKGTGLGLVTATELARLLGMQIRASRIMASSGPETSGIERRGGTQLIIEVPSDLFDDGCELEKQIA
ncbi:HAMP domain-containing sensor histidine kinase [Allohahella marinimesophila]|uniref:histidine kinase n=1 Tax=Allohahella marinimesophila TaxID=1054972 RepID=A0ABP7NQ92_9GAMM